MRMSRKPDGFDAAVVVVPADGLESVGVELVRHVVLFEGEQLARMPDHIRVGSPRIAIFGDGVTRVTVAVAAKERAAVLFLDLVTLGADVAALEIHVAVLEAEHDDHAFAVDEDVVAPHRRVLAVGTTAIENAVKVLRNRAIGDFAISKIRLETHWRAETLIER